MSPQKSADPHWKLKTGLGVDVDEICRWKQRIIKPCNDGGTSATGANSYYADLIGQLVVSGCLLRLRRLGWQFIIFLNLIQDGIAWSSKWRHLSTQHTCYSVEGGVSIEPFAEHWASDTSISIAVKDLHTTNVQHINFEAIVRYQPTSFEPHQSLRYPPALWLLGLNYGPLLCFLLPPFVPTINLACGSLPLRLCRWWFID